MSKSSFGSFLGILKQTKEEIVATSLTFSNQPRCRSSGD